MTNPIVRRLAPLNVKMQLRIPDWPTEGLLERKCPLCCSHGEPRYIRPDNLQVCFCSCCGLFFVSPSPQESTIIEFYHSYHTEYLQRKELNIFEAQAILSSDPMDNLIICEVLSVINPRGKYLLDVGCGTGELLASFERLGAIVTGIDLDQNAISFVKNMVGIRNVRCCQMIDLAEQSYYDIIIIKDFVEHVLFLRAQLEKAASLLAPGGLIVIWTPNASFADTDNELTLFRVDFEHMQYLTFSSCNYIADQLNLQIIHLESLGFPSLREFTEMNSKLKFHLKQIIKKMPTMHGSIMRLRHWRKKINKQNMRLGSYHLLSIFKKQIVNYNMKKH